MWRRFQRGNNATCSALAPLSVTSPTTLKWIMPFEVLPWSWVLGGWACVCSRTLWAPPMDCPARLGVSPTAATPTDFYSQRFLRFIFLHWNPGLCGLCYSPVIPPDLSTHNCGDHLVCQLPPCHTSSLPQLPISSPPTCLHECFFFNSLVVRLPIQLDFLAVLGGFHF